MLISLCGIDSLQLNHTLRKKDLNEAIDDAIRNLGVIYKDDRVYLDDQDLALTGLYSTMSRKGDVKLSMVKGSNDTFIDFSVSAGPLNSIVAANYGLSHQVNESIKLIVADLTLKHDCDELVLKMARVPLVKRLDTIVYLDQFKMNIKQKLQWSLNGNFMIELTSFVKLLKLFEPTED